MIFHNNHSMTSNDKELVKDANNNSMFNVFSEGLSKLKLKTPHVNPAKNKSLQASSQNQDAHTSLADLEKLLSQLKTSAAPELKEEAVSANARVRISINQDSKSVDHKIPKQPEDNKKNANTSSISNTSNSKINKSLSPIGNSQKPLADLMEQHPKLKMLSSINSIQSIKKDAINRSDDAHNEEKEDEEKNQDYSSGANEMNKVSENIGNMKKEANLTSNKMKSKPPLPTDTKANTGININQRDYNIFNPLSPVSNNNHIAARNSQEKRLEENFNDKDSLISGVVNKESKPRAMTAISAVSGSNVYNKPKSNSVRPKISINTQLINNEQPNNNISSIKSLYRYNPSELDKDCTIFSNLESNLFPSSPQSNLNKLNESSIDFQNSNFNAYLNPAGEAEGEAVPEREIELDNRNDFRQSKIDAEIKNNLSQTGTLIHPIIKSKSQTPLNRSEIKVDANANVDKSGNISRKINEKNVEEITKTIRAEGNKNQDKDNMEEIFISSSSSRTPSPISNRIKVESFQENDIKMKNSVLISNRGDKSQIISMIKENINDASISRHSKSVLSPDIRSKLHESKSFNIQQHEEASKLSELNILEKNENSRMSRLNVREKSFLNEKSKISDNNITQKSLKNEKSKLSELNQTDKTPQNEKSKLSVSSITEQTPQNEKSKLSVSNIKEKTPQNEKSKLSVSVSNITEKTPQLEKSKLSESNITSKYTLLEKSINNKSQINNKSNNNSAYLKENQNPKLSILNSEIIEEKTSIDILLYDKNKEGHTLKKLSSVSINEKNMSNLGERNTDQLNRTTNEEVILISEALNDSVILENVDNITTEPENQIDASLTNRYRRVLARQLINSSAHDNQNDKQNKSPIQNSSQIDNSKAPKTDTLNNSYDAKSNKSLNKSKTSIIDELFNKVTSKLRKSLSPARSLIHEPKSNEVTIGDKYDHKSFIKQNSNFEVANYDNDFEDGEAEKSKLNVKEISNLNNTMHNNSFDKSIASNMFIDKRESTHTSKIENLKISATIENKNLNVSDNRINKIDRSIEKENKSLKNDNTREGVELPKPFNSPSYLNKSTSKNFNAFDFGVDNKNRSKIITNDNNIFNAPDFNNLSEINLDFKEPNQTNQSVEVDYDMIKFKNKENANGLNKSLNKNINESNHNQSKANNTNTSAVENKIVTLEEIQAISTVKTDREEQPQDKVFLLPANNNLNYATFETFFNKHDDIDILELAPPKEDKEESFDFERPYMKSKSKSISLRNEEGVSKISDKMASFRNVGNSKIHKESIHVISNRSLADLNLNDPISNKVAEPVGNRSNIVSSTHNHNDSIINNNNISFNEDSIVELNFIKADPIIQSITCDIPVLPSTKKKNVFSSFNPAEVFNEDCSIEEIKMMELTPRNTLHANLIANLKKIDEDSNVKNSNAIAGAKKADIIRVNSIESATGKRDGRTSLNKSKCEDKNSLIGDAKNKSVQNLSAENEQLLENKNDIILVSNSSKLRTSIQKREDIISKDINKSIKEMPDNNNNLASKEISVDDLNYLDEKYKLFAIFEKDEEHYNQKIRNFDSIFMNVERYLPIRRRNAIMSNCYFKDYIMKEVNVFDKFKKNPKMFSENFEIALKDFEAVRDFDYIFQNVIGDDNNRKEETIEKLKKNNLINYRIGALQKSSNLALHYNFENSKSKSISNKFSSEISHFREVRCDGDSFYRSFMFSLFEYYILNQNIHEIKKLVLDIYSMNSDEDTTFSKMKGIDFKTVLIVFHLILDNLKKNNIQKAYEVFIAAYDLEDISLDMVLIGYMRITLWMISNVSGLEKLQNSVKTPVKKDIKKENLESGVENMTSSADKFEMDKFSFDTMLMYQNEPNKLVLTLSTLVFNVNLDVYVIDGSLSKVTSNELNYTRTRFSASTVNELPAINICYFLSNYYKVYDKQFSEKHNVYLSRHISNDFEAKIIVGNKFDCDKCGKDMKKIYFKKYSLMTCYECTKSYLDKLIEKRAQAFFIEDFNNREFYCRGFEIKEDVFFDEDDIYEIYGTNIANLLMTYLKESCIVCKKKIPQKSDIINLECRCILCKDCLKACVEQATNGQIVQNAFEKKCKKFV